MLLRQPFPTDYPILASWIGDARQCLRWAGSRIPYPFAVQDLPQLLVVPLPGATSWSLAGEGGELLGFGQLWEREPGCAHLGRIIVAPAVRGRGVGRILCAQLIAKAAECGYGRFSLRVYRDNASAVHLYQALGFAEIASEGNGEVCLMQAVISA